MVYQFRATIPESKIFYRVYEIKGDMTLFKFNSFIVDDLGFSPDQMVLYEGYTDGKLTSEYGLFDLGDGAMDTVTFDKVIAKGETELHYCFDLRNNRYILLVFEKECEQVTLRIYPYTSDEKGQNPDQFRARYEEAPVVPTLHPQRDGKRSSKEEDFDDDDFDDEDDDDEDEDDDKIFDEEEVYDKDE